MTEAVSEAMSKARAVWQEGKFQESAEIMQNIGTTDLPPQVASCTKGIPHYSYNLTHWQPCPGMLAQAQHNKLMAKFSAEEHQDPQGLLDALQALNQVSNAPELACLCACHADDHSHPCLNPCLRTCYTLMPCRKQAHRAQPLTLMNHQC